MTLTDAQKAALQTFIASDPGQQQQFADLGSSLENYADWFVQWWSNNAENTDPADYPQDAALLDALGYEIEGSSTATTMPIEQAISNVILDNYVSSDIAGDAQRKAIAQQLLSQYGPQFDASRNLISQIQSSPDTQAYLDAHPEVMAEAQRQVAAGNYANIHDYALAHYKAFGVNGTISQNTAYTMPRSSGLLRQELNANQQAIIEQQNALNQQKAALLAAGADANSANIKSIDAQIAALQAAQQTAASGFSANLAAQVAASQQAAAAQAGTRAGALDVEIASRVAAQKEETSGLLGNLATQMNQLGQALDVDSAARTANLAQMIDQLNTGLDQFSTEQKAALADQMAAEFGALETEVAAKKASLEKALAAMGAAYDTESAARKSALEAELATLTAAQGQLAQARIDGANALMTAVNIGTQSQLDQLQADAARQGYVGTSTGDQAAIARAAISGRQTAAQAMAQARLANAEDSYGLAQYGAKETRGLADVSAANTRELGVYGATEERTLADTAATGQRALTSYGAGQGREIASAVATGRQQIGATAATEGRSVADTTAANKLSLAQQGSNAQRTITDAGVTGARAIADYGSGQARSLADLAGQDTRSIADFAASQGRSLADASVTADKSIADLAANQRRGVADAFTARNLGIADNAAAQARGIADTGAQRKLSYFSNDLQRQLAALSLPAQALEQEFQVRNLADAYGQSGLQRSLQNLSFLQIGQSQAPTQQATQTQANTTTGSAFQNLGAGLVGLGGSIGNANNWWSSGSNQIYDGGMMDPITVTAPATTGGII